MRKYQPAWLEIAKRGTVILEAPANMHLRIYMGLKKEKTKDFAWKAITYAQGKKYKLKTFSEGNKLHVYLEKVAYFTDIDTLR